MSDLSTPLRVLLVSANYKPSIGGIERYVENLANGLAERGHAVTVVACRTDGGARDERDGAVRVLRIPSTDVLDKRLNVPYPLPSPIAATRVLRGLIAAADVVHPHDAVYATTVLALALARRAGVASVLTQHVAFVPQQNGALDVAQRAALATLGRSARLANRVVTYNPSVAAWAQEMWGLHDVPVLPSGVPEPPAIAREAVRREFGFEPGRFVALFAGRDVPKKGLESFLASRDDAFDLVAVTDRDPSSAPAGTHIRPFLPPEAFRRLLSAVDAFVLPSEAEGFPLALQEALLSGLPCVVTRGPGYGAFVKDDEAVFVAADAAEIRSALLRLARDEAWRTALSDRARDAGSREFGLGRFVSANEELYRRLVS